MSLNPSSTTSHDSEYIPSVTHSEIINDNEIIITFEIEDPELVSVNEQYWHPVRKTKNGKYYSYFAPTDQLTKVKEFYENILKEKISDEDIQKLQDTIQDREDGLSLHVILGFPDNKILEKDVSNFMKSIEDCVARRLGIDDVRNYMVTAEKRMSHLPDNRWIMKIIIKPQKLLDYLD